MNKVCFCVCISTFFFKLCIQVLTIILFFYIVEFTIAILGQAWRHIIHHHCV